MKIYHVLIFLGLLVLFSWFMKHEEKQPIQPSGNKVKIGIIAPFSGINKGKGKAGLQGIKIGQALLPYLNNGDAVELVLINDSEIPDISVQGLRKLAQEHQVACVLVFSDSDSVLAIGKVADRYKTPVLAVFASHPDITKTSAWINQFSFDDTFQASVAALYARDELLFDRVAILAQPDNAHYAYLARQFSRQFLAVEGEVTELRFLTSTEQDYSQILTDIKTKKPDLLYLPLDLESLFNIKKTLSALNWEPVLMVSDGMLASVKAQSIYPLNFMNGMLAVDTFALDMNFTHFGEQLLEQIDLMGISIKNTGTYTALGAEAYAFIVYVMNQCLAVNDIQTCINQTIRSTYRFEGLKGLISFDETGKAHRSLVINSIVDGRMEFIVEVY